MEASASNADCVDQYGAGLMSRNHRALAAVLAGEVPLQSRATWGTTLVACAAYGLWVEGVEALLAAGADPQLGTTTYTGTALEAAVLGACDAEHASEGTPRSRLRAWKAMFAIAANLRQRGSSFALARAAHVGADHIALVHANCARHGATEVGADLRGLLAREGRVRRVA